MTDIKDIIKKAFPLEELPTDEENNQFAEEAILKQVVSQLSPEELAKIKEVL